MSAEKIREQFTKETGCSPTYENSQGLELQNWKYTDWLEEKLSQESKQYEYEVVEGHSIKYINEVLTKISEKGWEIASELKSTHKDNSPAPPQIWWYQQVKRLKPQSKQEEVKCEHPNSEIEFNNGKIKPPQCNNCGEFISVGMNVNVKPQPQEKVDECEHEWIERCIQGCEYIECLECKEAYYKNDFPTNTLQDNGLREAAEKVVDVYEWDDWNDDIIILISPIVDLKNVLQKY